MAEVQRYTGKLVDAETGEVLPASPWRYTEAGLPVFESRSYDEHEGEWISKQQEGNAILWEMSAISYSLVGLAAREADAQGVVKRFAGKVKRTATLIRKYAAAYALRAQLEVEDANRFAPLTESLDVKHYVLAAEGILNRAETNAVEAGEWLEKADDDGWTGAELKRQMTVAKRAALEAAPWPADTFQVVYADPPWEYSSSGLDQYGPAERHYPTMSTDKLCALDTDDVEGFASRVRGIAGDEAVLFMWATSPTLPDALRVIEAWGFVYKSSFVWDKVGHNYGHYNSVRHELLLIATKGSCLPDSQELYDSVVTIDKSTIHSEKPARFREMIDELYTWGPRVELFSRGEVPEGWFGWGNEAS